MTIQEARRKFLGSRLWGQLEGVEDEADASITIHIEHGHSFDLTLGDLRALKTDLEHDRLDDEERAEKLKALCEVNRLAGILHRLHMHPDYEYTTDGPRSDTIKQAQDMLFKLYHRYFIPPEDINTVTAGLDMGRRLLAERAELLDMLDTLCAGLA